MTGFIDALRSNTKLAFFLTLAIGYGVGAVKIRSFKISSVTSILITGVIIRPLKISRKDVFYANTI